MTFGKRLGVGLMAFLALAIQPMQYSIMANMGSALAAPMDTITEEVMAMQELMSMDFSEGNLSAEELSVQRIPCASPMRSYPIPGPVTPCNPRPTPPKPTPTPKQPKTGPVTAKYYLLPGLGDTAKWANGQSGYFHDTHGGNTSFWDFVNSSNSTSYPVSISVPYADWKNDGIAVQADEVAAKLKNDYYANSNNKFVLVGHSMGGVRGRQTLQFDKNVATENVVGLVTIGSPHTGAPIIALGPQAATKLGGTVGAMIGYFGGPKGIFVLTLAGTLSGKVVSELYVEQLTDSPSGKDLMPGSAFMRNLNAYNAPKLPSHVQTLRVSGGNNSVDSLVASILTDRGSTWTTQEVKNVRKKVAKSLAAMTCVGIIVAIFNPWLATLAIAAGYAFKIVSSIPTFWKEEVVGSAKGDAIVPADSQLLPVSAGGGHRSELMLEQAVHTGAYSEYQVNSVGEYTDNVKFKQKFIEFQRDLNLPPSTLETY